MGRQAAAEALTCLRRRIPDGGRRYDTYFTWLQLRAIADRTGIIKGTISSLAGQLHCDRHTLVRHLGDLVAAELVRRTNDGWLTLPRPTTSTGALRGRGWVYTAATALTAATAVLVAADAVITNRPRGSPRRARAAAGALEALRHLAARHDTGQLWSGRRRLCGTEDTAAWLGVDPSTWRAWQRLATGAGWLTHDGRGWVLRDTAALEGNGAADPGGAFFGAALRLAGANFGPSPFMDSPLQSPLPPPPESADQGPGQSDDGEEPRCPACGAHRALEDDERRRDRDGRAATQVTAMLEALYERFPTHRSQLRIELPGALPLRRHLRRLADAGASPAWVAAAIGQPLGGLTSVVAGLTARARLALQRWAAEQARAQQVAEQQAAAAAAAAQRAAEQAAETARWTRAATAAAALPADLRSRAERRIAGGLLPALRTEATVRGHLHAWCVDALERADGRSLADLLLEDLSADSRGPFASQEAPVMALRPSSPPRGASWAQGTAAAAALPPELRQQAEAAIAERLAPAHRTPLHVEAELHGWCARALERAEGQPLADLLLEDLAANVDLTSTSNQPAA